MYGNFLLIYLNWREICPLRMPKDLLCFLPNRGFVLSIHIVFVSKWSLVNMLWKCVCKHFLINLVMQHSFILMQHTRYLCFSWVLPDLKLYKCKYIMYLLQHCKFSPYNNYRNSLCNHCKIHLSPIMFLYSPFPSVTMYVLL